jgi:hypothetical protein
LREKYDEGMDVIRYSHVLFDHVVMQCTDEMLFVDSMHESV